jgi:RNA polymerase sigma-B factor
MLTEDLEVATTTDAPSPEPGCPAPDPRAELTSSLLVRANSETCPVQRRRLLEQVVLLNRSVAEGVASRYRNRGIAQEDLHQVAYEGLTKAVLRFDPSLSDDLLTYAVPTIRGEVQRYLRDQGWSVRPPRRVLDLQRRILQADQELTQRLGREPQAEEVREELGLPADEYGEALAAFACKQATSLDRPVGIAHTEPLGNLLSTDDAGRSAAEARLVLQPALRSLGERDREILYLRFFEDLTQKEIGDRLGVTQMQVSRLLSQLLARLRLEVAA